MARPRRRNTIRRIRTKLMDSSDPRYYPLLARHDSQKTIRLMHGHLINEAMKNKKVNVGTIFEIKEGGAKRKTVVIGEGTDEIRRHADRLLADRDTAIRQLYEGPFTQEERPIIQSLLNYHVVPLAKSTRIRMEFDRQGRRYNKELHQEITDSPNPYELYDAAQSMDELIREQREKGTSTTRLTQINTELLRVTMAAFVLRDLKGLGWKGSANEIYQAIVHVAPLPLDTQYFSDHMDEIRKRVEKQLRKQYNETRQMTERTRLHRAMVLRGPLVEKENGYQRTGGPLTRFLKLLSPFEISRAKRKEIRTEFINTILEKKDARKETRRGGLTYKGLVRYQVAKAFKASRLHMREKLTRIGMNPDEVLGRLELISGSGTSNITIDMMRRLNVLSGVLREKKTIGEAKIAVDDMIMRFRAAKYPSEQKPASPSPHPIQRPTPSPVNENKRLKREERRRRRAEAQKTAQVSPSSPKVELPNTLPELLDFESKSKRISGPLYSRLRDVLHQTRPTEQNERFIIEGLKIIILCVRVSNYGVKGRVEPDVLRKKVSPTHLHIQFGRALDELIHERKLKYELHGHKNDYINLTDEFRNQALGRYDFRRADDQSH